MKCNCVDAWCVSNGLKIEYGSRKYGFESITFHTLWKDFCLGGMKSPTLLRLVPFLERKNLNQSHFDVTTPQNLTYVDQYHNIIHALVRSIREIETQFIVFVLIYKHLF